MIRLIPHVLFMLLVSGAATYAENAEMLRVEGRAARLAGQLDHAIAKLQQATDVEPRNADIHVEMGLTLTGLKRYAEADAAFRHALEIAPNAVDARLGLARLAYFQGRYVAARARAIELAGEAPDSDAKGLLAQVNRAIAAQTRKSGKAAPPRKTMTRETMAQTTRIDLDAYDVTPAPTPTRWRIDLDGSHSTLSGDRPAWLEANGRIAYDVQPGTALSGGVQAARRNDEVDSYLDVRLDRKLSPSASFYLQSGMTPNADFLAEWSLGMGGAVRLYQQPGVFAATVLTLDTRFSEYTTGMVETYSTGLEQYLMGGRIWLTLRWIHIIDADGGHHDGYLARGDVMVNDQLRIFGGYADSPETDDGLAVIARSLFGKDVLPRIKTVK